MRELKAAFMTRLARRAMTSSTSGLDGLAKSMLQRAGSGARKPDPELEHPDDWDRPID